MSGLRGMGGAVSGLARSIRAGRTPRALACASGASLMFLALAFACAVLLDPQHGLITTYSSWTLAEGAATTACVWTARQTRGAERRWRLLIGATALVEMITSFALVLTLLAGRPAFSRDVSPGYYVILVIYAIALAGAVPATDPMEGRAVRRPAAATARTAGT